MSGRADYRIKNMPSMTYKIAKKYQLDGQQSAQGMSKSLNVAMTLFLIYPLFRNLLGEIDAVWYASMLAGAYIILRSFKPTVVLSSSFVAWFAIAVVALVSFLILGSAATGTPKRVLTFVVTILLVLSLSTNKSWIRPTMRIVLCMLLVHALATLLFAVMPGVYTGFVKPRFFAGSQDAIGAQSGLTAHYSYNGMLLSAGVLLSAAELWSISDSSKGDVKALAPNIVVLLAFVLALLVTSKRGPLLAVIAALVLGLYVGSGKYKFNAFLKIGLFACSAVCIVAVLSQFVPQISAVFERFAEISGGLDDADATNGRSYLWERAIELWQSSPVIGHGWGTYRYYWEGRLDVATSTAHNVFLNLLAEVGIVGFLVFLVAAVPPFVGLWRAMSRRSELGPEAPAVTFAFMFQIFFLVYSFTGSPLYDVESYIFYLLLSCGVWFALFRSVDAVQFPKHIERAGVTNG